MALQYTPYTPVLAVATIAGAIATGFAWRLRSDPAARWAAYCNASVTAWAGLHLVLLSSTGYAVKLVAFTLLLGNIGLLSTLVLAYVLHYTGRDEWLTPRRSGALLAVLGSYWLAILTNGFHELFFAGLALDGTGGFVELVYDRGPAWYGYAAVYHTFNFVSLAVLGQKLRRSRNVYRKLTFAIFLVISIPIAGSVVSTVGYSPFPHYVLMPHLVVATSALAVVTTTGGAFFRLIPLERLLSPFQSRFGTLVPLARDVVAEEVDNGIIVLDADGRIVDINSTGKRMIGAGHPIGNHLLDAARTELLIDRDSEIDLDAAFSAPAELAGFRDELWVASPGGDRCYAVEATAIEARGEPAGAVVMLHDITRRKRREEELRDREAELRRQKANLELQTRKLEHQNERLDEFAGIVSHDLRNPLNVAGGYLGEIDAAIHDDDRDVDPAFVDEIRRAHDRMETIIEDALTLAREGRSRRRNASPSGNSRRRPGRPSTPAARRSRSRSTATRPTSRRLRPAVTRPIRTSRPIAPGS